MYPADTNSFAIFKSWMIIDSLSLTSSIRYIQLIITIIRLINNVSQISLRFINEASSKR